MDRPASALITFKKRAMPNAVRRGVAIKYGGRPGEQTSVPCHYCSAPGRIYWRLRFDGTPDCWVAFDHELDHVVPEFHGGESTVEIIVLACRPCNRGKGARVA
jgi:hypothetical protein